MCLLRAAIVHSVLPRMFAILCSTFARLSSSGADLGQANWRSHLITVHSEAQNNCHFTNPFKQFPAITNLHSTYFFTFYNVFTDTDVFGVLLLEHPVLDQGAPRIHFICSNFSSILLMNLRHV